MDLFSGCISNDSAREKLYISLPIDDNSINFKGMIYIKIGNDEFYISKEFIDKDGILSFVYHEGKENIDNGFIGLIDGDDIISYYTKKEILDSLL